MPTSHDDNDIVVRPAVQADCATIGVLWEKLVRYHRDLDDKLPLAAADGAELYAKRIEDRLNDTHTHILVAIKDDEVIGFVLGLIVDMVPEMFQPSVGGFLADIFVEEAHRAQGVGKLLVKELTEWFRSRGVGHMELYVASKNISATAFWKAMGSRESMVRMRLDI